MGGTGGMRGRGKRRHSGQRKERGVMWGCDDHVSMSSCLSLLTSPRSEVRRVLALLNPLHC